MRGKWVDDGVHEDEAGRDLDGCRRDWGAHQAWWVGCLSKFSRIELEGGVCGNAMRGAICPSAPKRSVSRT